MREPHGGDVHTDIVIADADGSNAKTLIWVLELGSGAARSLTNHAAGDFALAGDEGSDRPEVAEAERFLASLR